MQAFYRDCAAMLLAALISLTGLTNIVQAQRVRPAEPPYPPTLPGGQEIVTDNSPDFLKPTSELQPGVSIAKTPPTIDFMYYPGQNYPGKPWSNWGDGVAVDGKYYSAIGDHLAVSGKGDGEHGNGNAILFEYDLRSKSLRALAETAKVLDMPPGHYTPGKIHSRIDLGSDGWLYYATHRGSTGVTTDAFHYQGDWILRTNPETGKTEVVAHGPVSKHCIPTSVLDSDRLIFYGGTAAGSDSEHSGDQFFAYDCKNHELLYSGPNGPARYLMFARSTGRLYYVPGKGDGPLMRFDPEQGGAPVEVPNSHIGCRAATEETPDGFIYTVSLGRGQADADLWSFNTKTEAVKKIGTAAVGSQGYIASIDADPTGRYLYYTAGAHGSGDRDGTPVVQFDVKTGTKKVLAFLHPFYQEKYGCTLKGTFSTAIDPAGDKLYITWNVSRGSKAWDSCGLTVIHIPPSERPVQP